MSDVFGSLTTWLGIKATSLVAGFAGAVVALSYLRELTRWQMAIAVLNGCLCATFLTPGLTYYFDLPAQLENTLSFLLGLTAMNIVPALIKLSERFRRNPTTNLRDL